MPGTKTLPQTQVGWLIVPQWLWPAIKGLLIIAIVIAVGWQFASILRKPEFWKQSFTLRPAGIAAAAGLYIAGLGFPAIFWYCLLRSLGQQPTVLTTLRAYYVGQLGRYIPGKVVGLGMRARLLTGPDVSLGAAVLTVVYETLTSLTSAGLLGLILLVLQAADETALTWQALALCAVVGCLLMPRVFNFLADRTSKPFRRSDSSPLPRVRKTLLVVGLAIETCGWLVQGGALYVVVAYVSPNAWPTWAEGLLYCTGYVALAYAGGFLVLAAPAGLGVRDYLIQHFLTDDLSRTMDPNEAMAIAVAVALLMRLLWTVLDVTAAGVCYWLLASPKPTGGHSDYYPETNGKKQ